MSDILARYAFLPWMRQGLAAKIEEAENFNDLSTPPPDGWTLERPRVDVKINIEARKGDTTHNDHVDQSISLVGPGDITGINPRVVVKTEPRNWITNFEPNYFPYIDFYEEDFPWRYTPAKANGQKLRPWFVLVALKESEFKRNEGQTGPLPTIFIQGHEADPSGTSGAASRVFPDPSQTWAWSHVQLNADLDPTNSLDPELASDLETALNRFRQLLAANPDQACSRMVCPRKLEPNTTYYCFLLPAFETGRLAGLGAEPEIIAGHAAQEASFGQDHSTDAEHSIFADTFPYYYEWQFMTGEVGDFESLVRKLVPREVDPRVGTRPMDVQEPGFNISYDPGPPPNDGTLMLEGALLPPNGTTTRQPYPWSNDAPTLNYRKKLAQLLNLSEDLMEATFPPDQFFGTNPFGYEGDEEAIQDDPIITPFLYGRWHVLQNTIPTSPVQLNRNIWFNEMNLDPRSRVVAGLGVKHVKNNQETLMDKAWDQLGEVIEANRQLRWGQFSQQVSYATYTKHIINQHPEQANAIASRLYSRIKSGSVTAYSKVRKSALPNATQSYAYRRIERPQGPLMKRLDPNNTIFTQNALRVSLANKSKQAVDPKVIGEQTARLAQDDLRKDVDVISKYFVNEAIFSPGEPGTLEIEPDVESEMRFQIAVEDYAGYFEEANWTDVDTGPALDLGALANEVVAEINPIFTIQRMVYHKIIFTGTIYPIPPPEKIVQVMAYPVFKEPMYDAVNKLGVDFFIPNLHLIPDNSITLLESNQRFIEAFLLGSNHEMGRELLWREYPTDQRGSYFRQFWDSTDKVNTSALSEEELESQNLDIEEIHTWPSNSELGTHNARQGAPDTGLLVLVIRGDLLKKYPNTVVYAQEAAFKAGSDHSVDPRELAPNKQYPLFTATIDPDIHFFGFNLTADQARGDRDTSDPGWFFVLQERPGEIRFGLDIGGSSAPPATWNDLAQNNAAFNGIHLEAGNNAVNTSAAGGNEINGKPVNWGFNATNFAQILFQNPVLLAVHGDEMIP